MTEPSVRALFEANRDPRPARDRTPILADCIHDEVTLIDERMALIRSAGLRPVREGRVRRAVTSGRRAFWQKVTCDDTACAYI